MHDHLKGRGTAGPALLRTVDARGLYARTAVFEEAARTVSALIDESREAGAEILRFPPVMSRHDAERSGYLASFPHLLGCVSCLSGTEEEIRLAASGQAKGDWVRALSATDLVLTPAACYPLYPLLSRGNEPIPQRLLFDVESYCFRNEGSAELGRFQAFVMREFVCVGSAAAVSHFREEWISRGQELAKRLGLVHRIAPASDPFFGRVGKLLASSQIEDAAKFELLVEISGGSLACMSFNYHRDHFAKVWGLRMPDGEVAHTACVAFGIDRLALALLTKRAARAADGPDELRHVVSIG